MCVTKVLSSRRDKQKRLAPKYSPGPAEVFGEPFILKISMDTLLLFLLENLFARTPSGSGNISNNL